MRGIEVINPGLTATIQDLGRYKHQIEGFPVSGALDQKAHRLANLLVNNLTNAATIEFCLLGPKLRFFCPTFIAITGSDSYPKLNEKVVPLNRTIQVFTGDILTFNFMQSGRWGYLAVANGGIRTSPILDSRSTTLRAQLGGLDGGALKKGDRLPIKESYIMPSLSYRKISVTKNDCHRIRFLKGPQWHLFSEKAQTQFTGKTFTVSQQADRMGYRLSEKLSSPVKESLLSEGTVFGNVQITRDGQAIVLLADRQTTGGYPVIATIIAADFSDFVQMPIGQKFNFVETDLKTATQEFFIQRQHFKRIFDNWHRQRYQFPIGPSRKAATKIEKLIESEN
ncbi:biotin-dependent carboxyltransferase family protein [Oenococcus sp. UCMA 17063]|nr:biotin-dependent carboxyltransferase family protein [Oenococcus sp. UCMA 17063]